MPAPPPLTISVSPAGADRCAKGRASAEVGRACARRAPRLRPSTMRVFITGATGFIGSWVSYRLLAAGHDLVALARAPSKLPALWQEPRVRCVEGRLTDFDVIAQAMKGCDACVHIALGWGETATSMLALDTRPTAFLVETAAALGLKRFIYTSSTAALGPFFDAMNETHPLRPDTLYGATKAACEAYVLAVSSRSSLSCNVIRPGYTFGNPVVPGASPQSDRRFRTIAEGAVRGESIELSAGDGTQFIWAGDLARLYVALLESERDREIYFALSEPFTSWERIAQYAIERCNSRSRILLAGDGGPPALFELGKIREHFGLRFDPQHELRAHVDYWLSVVGRAAASSR